MRTLIMSVDVEHVELDAEGGTHRFLRLFERHGVTATFFMTGEVLNALPSLATDITASGHELASHGATKTMPGGPYIDQMSHAEMVEEIRRSHEIFAERGFPIEGFRAPAFRVTRESLAEIGRHFSYDSSLSPGAARRVGLPHRYGCIGELAEFPVGRITGSSVPTGSSPLMILGGHPAGALLRYMTGNEPLVFYTHSFDLCGSHAGTLPSAAWKRFWYFSRCGAHQEKFFSRILKWLDSAGFQFCSCREYLAKHPPGSRLDVS